MKKLIFSMLTFTLIIFSVMAQDTDVKKSDAIMEESLQNYEKAAQLYEEAAMEYEKKGTIDSTCWLRAGICQLKLKNDQKAVTMFSKLESNNIITGELCYYMGDAYYGLKQFNKSESYLKKAIELDPNIALNANKKLVLVSYNSKKFDNAINYANKSLKLDSTDTNTLYLKMLAQEMKGDINGGVISGEKLLTINPSHSKGIEKLGLLYAKQTDEKYDKEKKRYAAMKAPTRVDFHNTTKKLNSISQEYKKAIPLLEKALAKKPNNEMVKKALDSAKSRMNAQ
ncbi:MAG: tetratricopeptide repeat protein [Marinilabiliaceae bacterium]|nr:tetratricopeptide repeat protein [Marinilabiliaceae bacterium]